MPIRPALLAAAAAAALGAASSAQAITFDFTFGTEGSGTLSFDGDPAAGDYDVFGLPNLDILFTFGPTIFTEDDITTTTPVDLRITGAGDDREAVFFSTMRGDGCTNGALDFRNADGDCLSTGPDEAVGLYVLNVDDGGLVNEYGGTIATAPPAAVIPLPAGGVLLLGALGALGAARRLRG